jgi:hypothetical protein
MYMKYSDIWLKNDMWREIWKLIIEEI